MKLLLLILVLGAIITVNDAQHGGQMFQFFRGFGNTFKPVQHMFHHASAIYFATFLRDY